MFFSKLKCEKNNGFSAWYLVMSTYVFGIRILFTISTAPSTQYSALFLNTAKDAKQKKANSAKRNLLFYQVPITQYPILLYHFHGTLNENREFFAFQHVLR